MHGSELFDDGGLLGNALLIAFLEFVETTLLLVEVLDEPSSSLLHLIQTAFESEPVRYETIDLILWLLDITIVSSVLRVPNIMRYEFFKGYSPMIC